MKVVEADASHVPYLSRFGRQSFIHSYQCTLPQKELEAYVDAAFPEAAIRAEMASKLATFFVCLDPAADDPCGYAKLIQSSPPACVDSGGCIELQRLYVASDHRGQGVGKRLAVHAETYARNQGAHHVWLRVWDGNLTALDIYSRWNYTLVGEEPYRVGDQQRTVLVMQKCIR